LAGKQQAMARRAGGQNAVHHIDTESGVFGDLLRRTHPHYVTRLVGGKMLERGFDDLASTLPGLAHAEAADGIAGETDLDRTLRGLFSKRKVHAALNDAEQ